MAYSVVLYSNTRVVFLSLIISNTSAVFCYTNNVSGICQIKYIYKNVYLILLYSNIIYKVTPYKDIKGNISTHTNTRRYNRTSVKYLKHMLLIIVSATLSSYYSLATKPQKIVPGKSLVCYYSARSTNLMSYMVLFFKFITDRLWIKK